MTLFRQDHSPRSCPTPLKINVMSTSWQLHHLWSATWLRTIVLASWLHASTSKSRGQHRRSEDMAKWVREMRLQQHEGDLNNALRSALSVVSEALRSIEEYYEGDLPLLKRVACDPSNPDVNLRNRMMASLFGEVVEKRRLVMGVIGGSTAAGERVWGSTAWPMILRSRLRPVFEQLGAELEVRNQAVPHRPEFPDNLCLTPILGRDVDLVLREWRRTNWDLGLFLQHSAGWSEPGWPRDSDDDWIWNRNASHKLRGKLMRSARLVRRRDLAAFEVFLRTALLIKSRPSVHVVALDPDGGDNASAFRHALNKGGVLYDAYRRFDINFFSAFGPPFDHLRRLYRGGKADAVSYRAPEQLRNCTNLAVCPLQPERQDGHHTRPAKLGFDPNDHPAWAVHSRPGELFVDGHLGVLGHELVGNQLAYYYLRVLNDSVTWLLSSPQSEYELARMVTTAHTPRKSYTAKPVLCGGILCPEDGRARPRCAYSSLPKAGPLDVGDLIANSTGVTRWRNVAVDDGARCDLLDPRPALVACNRADDSRACFEYHAACSHQGVFQTRAFEGYSGSGALQLDVDFPRDSRCAVLIAEPVFRSKKPLTMANWFHELKVVVEGGLCTEPACRIIQGKIGASAQSLFIDLTKLDHCAQCQSCWTLQPVHIDLYVDPLLQMATNVCGLASTGKCVPVGRWKHYDLGCTRKPPDPARPGKTECWRPLMTNVVTGETTDVRNPQLVKLAVSTVVAF